MRQPVRRLVFTAALLAVALGSRGAAAAPESPDTMPGESPGPKQGEVVQTDTFGMNMVSWNLDNHKTTTVANQAGLSEFVGAHWFFADRWRAGMNFQFTELLTAPPPGADRFSTFALLPQVGWHFYDPFFAAVVFTFAPRTRSGAELDLGLQGVVGAGLELADGVKLTMALEVPYNFYFQRTIGITPLAGLSIRL